MNNFFLSLFFFLALSSLCAQETRNDPWGSWLQYSGTHKVNDRQSFYTELQLNHYEFLTNYNVFWAIAVFNHALSNNTAVSVGYGYFNSDPTLNDIPGESNTNENRILEQFTLHSNPGKLKIQHRYRIEHRFFPGDTQHRFRYRLQLTHPLSKLWFANVSNEVFLNLQEPVFDQNRLFLALGYRFNDNINLQAGYLKLHFTRRNPDRIQLVLTINSDLRTSNK